MPKVKPIAKSETFNALNTVAFLKGETNDCGVKAISLAGRIPYDQAHAMAAAKGRKAKACMWRSDIKACIEATGKKLTRIDPREIIATYPGVHGRVLKSITTHHPRRFAKVWPKGTFLLFQSGHVSVVIDGTLHDWAVNNAKIVTEIYRVD